MVQPVFWGVHRLTEDRQVPLAIGEILLEIRSLDGDIWWWWRNASETVREDAPDPWTRWVTGTEPTTIELLPCLPDRPVVVEPVIPFRIAPRSRTHIYVGLPIWASLCADQGAEVVVAELPLYTPSDTWWGAPTEGEPAYRIRTEARRSLPERALPLEDAVCRLELINQSDEALPVDKVAVRAPQLAVYEAEDGFWTNEVRVTFTSDVEGSSIDILDGPPTEAGLAKRLTPPRNPVPRGWRALTFSRLVRTGWA